MITREPRRNDGRITPLSRSTSTKLRSSLIVPTYPSILSELVHNSLDADATAITIYLRCVTGDERFRVEDNGTGIDWAGLHRLGGRYETSKDLSDTGFSPLGSLGFRGEALSSIAALGLVEITTRPVGSQQTWSKVIKASNVLYEGSSSRSISSPHGTTVMVKEIFHNVPVRQNSMSLGNPWSTLTACKKAVEALALVRPDVKWTVWDEGSASGSSAGGMKKILDVQGTKSTINAYRTLYGTAGVERVQNIRVIAGPRRVEGFISLSGLLHKSHQHFYINHHPVERGELQHAISKRFQQSRFSAFNQDDDFFLPSINKRKSPRRLERFPIYVLNVILPPDDIDVMYNPQKSVIGHRDKDAVKGLVLAVIDEFLKQHGFLSGPMEADDPSLSLDRLPARKAPALDRPTPLPRKVCGQAGLLIGPSPPVTPVRKRPRSPVALSPDPITPERPKASAPLSQNGPSNPQGQNNIAWLDELISESRCRSRMRSRQVWASHGNAPQETDRQRVPSTASPSEEHMGCRYDVAINLPKAYHPLTDITFSASALDEAKVLGQVDRKFVVCVMPSEVRHGEPSRQVVVVIDQHAADERTAVEVILDELAEGFIRHSIPLTEMHCDVDVILNNEEAQVISRPQSLEILKRWGIRLEVPQGKGDYTQVELKTVPTGLVARLGRQGGAETTRLLKQYLPVLEAHLGEIRAFTMECDANEDVDTARAIRWMPKEMIELANSKACRGAIMFGDKLSDEQCGRLIRRLRDCRTPFICAHGRPSLVPLFVLDEKPASGRRRIDWAAWKSRKKGKDVRRKELSE